MSENNRILPRYQLTLLIFGIAFITFIVIIVNTTVPYLKMEISVGELVIGVSTVILGFATVILALTEMEEGRRDRIQTIDVSEKERRRLRLQEQLKELYSPLRARMEYIFKEKRDYIIHFKDIVVEYDIENKYEYVAKDKLKELMREYFTNLFNLDSSFLKRLRLKEGSDMADTYIITKITEIKDTIISDYESLIEEYDKLTKI